MSVNQVKIKDHGHFFVLINPSSKINSKGVAIEKGGIVARLEEIGGRDFITLEKWMITRREIIDHIAEDQLDKVSRGTTPQDTLSNIMQMLVKC